ncbi:MAG: hydroxyisourate hydrolase [Chloroflexota bacterium]
MATISSHVLDSIVGDHARHIRVACFRLIGETGKQKVFDVIANEDGRITEQVDVDNDPGNVSYELVFHSADYFKAQPATPEARQIMDTVVVRISIPEPQAKIHIPVVLSPHAYTVWWSA